MKILFRIPPQLDALRHDLRYAIVRNWTIQFLDKAESLAKQVGVYTPFIYGNYGSEFQDVIAGYGAQSVGFLKNMSNKYDPNGVFQNRVPGGGYKFSRPPNDWC